MELDARVIAVGKDEGLDFAFDRIERTPNTLDAHRLIWLADKEGVQDAVVEALFRAYFTEGRDISNRVRRSSTRGCRRWPGAPNRPRPC